MEKAARQQGWGVSRNKKGHWVFKSPDKNVPLIVHSGTPSDHRAVKNLDAMLRRNGLVLR